MNRVWLHDTIEILKEAGSIVQKEILASPDVGSSWSPSVPEMLTKKLEAPTKRQKKSSQLLIPLPKTLFTM